MVTMVYRIAQDDSTNGIAQQPSLRLLSAERNRDGEPAVASSDALSCTIIPPDARCNIPKTEQDVNTMMALLQQLAALWDSNDGTTPQPF